MNIYILSDNFTDSSRCLDTARLRKQTMVLAQIISNILRIDEDYKFIFKNNFYNNTGISIAELDALLEHIYSKTLLPIKFETHSSCLWAMKSPVHFMFIICYFNTCVQEFAERQRTAPYQALKIRNEIRIFFRELGKIICYGHLDSFLGLKEDLYRNIPLAEITTTDTPEAYRKYIIHHWKNDINKQFEYNNALKLHTSGDGPKPRTPISLTWRRGSNLTYIPDFAREELEKHIESIKIAS